MGVARLDTELPVKSITVAVLGRIGNVGVWHSMAQNWHVIHSRWLYSEGEARSLCGMPWHISGR